jgi:hypothetical protein
MSAAQALELEAAREALQPLDDAAAAEANAPVRLSCSELAMLTM